MTNCATERDWRSSTLAQLAAVRNFSEVNMVQILRELQRAESQWPKHRMSAHRSPVQWQKLREGGPATILDRPRRARCLHGLEGRVDASTSCVTGEEPPSVSPCAQGGHGRALVCLPRAGKQSMQQSDRDSAVGRVMRSVMLGRLPGSVRMWGVSKQTREPSGGVGGRTVLRVSSPRAAQTASLALARCDARRRKRHA